MAESNGFPLDLPDTSDPIAFSNWQDRVVERLDFTINSGTTTADAIETIMAAIVLEPLTCYIVESWALGVLNSTSGTLAVGQTMLNVWRAGVKLNSSNVATLIGAGVTKIYSGVNLSEASEPWTTNLAVSGKNIEQSVTGASSDIVIWRSSIKLFKVSI